MQIIRQLASAGALAMAVLAPGVVLAHGESHAAKPGAVKAEQREWGIAAPASAATRSVAVTMGDSMRFTPDRIAIRQGETVRFVVRNTGKVMHEFVIGTRKENDEHAALMLKFPNMEHDEPHMAHVPPGQTGSIVWTFNRAGDFEFACLIAGHHQAGMVGRITVAAR